MAIRYFDEIWGQSRGRTPRPGFESIARWIRETPRRELIRRQDSAETAFRQLGITFNVYGEDEEAEREPTKILRDFYLEEVLNITVDYVRTIKANKVAIHSK